ncbi:MAG: trigger factor, partial [Clostridia bacterium]|nr:trigger factor [Clostridia bacterium]
MLKSAEKTGTNEYTLVITVSAEDFNAAVNKVYHKQKNSINVPGFRKGKAPRAMIERIYGEGVFYDDAINDCFPAAYDAAVEESGIDPVDQPRDFDLKHVGKDGLEIECKVTVRPEVNVVGYKGIEAEKPDVEVTDEDVEKDLKAKQEANAREISVEDRAAKEGDIATIDFEGFTDGVAFEGGKGEDYDLELGSGSFIPGFEDQIVG